MLASHDTDPISYAVIDKQKTAFLEALETKAEKKAKRKKVDADKDDLEVCTTVLFQ